MSKPLNENLNAVRIETEPGEVPAIDPDDEFLKEGWPGTVRNPRKSDVTL